MRRAMTQPQKPKGLIKIIQQRWSILLGGGSQANQKLQEVPEVQKVSEVQEVQETLKIKINMRIIS